MAGKAHKQDSTRLKKSFLEQAEALWDKCDGKFFEALEESESKRLKLNFGVAMNLSEKEFVVDVDLSFKDKTTEGGLDVNKTFHAKRRDKLDDPEQPDLPGTKGKGKQKPSEEPGAAAE
jgi:hypothetical protein